MCFINDTTIIMFIVLFVFLACIPTIGLTSLFDWDEVNFAECAREMIVTKDYFNVTINFEAFWEKPPLFIWMQTLSMLIFGINEFGVIKKEPNTSWELILKFRTAPFNFIVYQLAYIGNNEILAATTDGLYKYDISAKGFKRIYKDKTNANFRSIYNLGEYYLLGTYGAGIYMYKSDTIKQLPLDQNQYLKYAHCFIEDDQNRIWASTNKGLFMAPKQSLIDFWHIGPGKIIYKYFGKLEGIDVLELNGGTCEKLNIQAGDTINYLI